MRLREFSTDARYFCAFCQNFVEQVRYGGNAGEVVTTGNTEEHKVVRGLFFPGIPVDHTLDSVPQVGDVEIDQQADPDAA